MDIEKIIKENNFEKIENVISHLIDVPLGVLLNNQILDSGVAKYFNLLQLSLQYLLFCIKFLDKTIIKLKSTLNDTQSEKIEFKLLYEENNQQLLQLYKKIEHLENINKIVYPCSMCTKNFISNEMLNIHIAKRHSNENHKNQQELTTSTIMMMKNATDTDRNLINTIKLELEVKHLKERLNNTEKEMRDKLNCYQQLDKQLNINHSNQNKNNENVNVEIKNQSLSKIEIDPSKKLVLNNNSTQTDNIHTHNVGIQNNLEDHKENDEINDDKLLDQEKYLDYDIINEIKEKILQLENFNNLIKENTNKDMDNIKQNIDEEVNEKLNKILNTIETTIIKQNENLNKIYNLESISANNRQSIQENILKENIDFIQKEIKENLSKFYEDNLILQINQTFEKFQNHLKESLSNIEIKQKDEGHKKLLVKNDDENQNKTKKELHNDVLTIPPPIQLVKEQLSKYNRIS